MNRFKPRRGTPAPYHRHMDYIADSVDLAFRTAFSDYIATSSDFYISGAAITSTPSGGSVTHAITDGFACFKGEFLHIDAHSIVQLSSQVVYLELYEDAVDVTPVLNVDGSSDQVMLRRRLRLRVGPVYPTSYMALNAPTKAALDQQRFGGRLVVPGMIVPYAGSMSLFDGSGLGIAAMSGWAVCNGLNGTVDMRGLVAVGATNVPDAGAPTVSSIVSGGSNPLELSGADMVLIEADNLPEHVHPYTYQAVNFNGGSPVGGGGDGTRQSTPATTSPNSTPNDPVSVKQAGRALVWVQNIAA